MNKKKLLISCFLLYSLGLYLFLISSFEISCYEEGTGQVIKEKEAILFTKKKLTKTIGYIENKKVNFVIQKQEKQGSYYLNMIVFTKLPKEKFFKLYFKKNQKSLLQILREEWRIEWKS